MKYKYAQIKELPEFDKTHNLAGNLSFRIEPWAEGGLFDVIYWNEYNFGDSKVKKMFLQKPNYLKVLKKSLSSQMTF